MQKAKKITLCVLLTAFIFLKIAVSAEAADLPAGMIIGDQNGIRVSTDGAYFINAEGLKAEDVITKQLTILNTEPYSYKLSMTAEPLEETGPLKLLDEVRCTLKIDGRILYDGRVRGDEGINMIQNALDLGTYRSGEQRVLEITLAVSPEMEGHFWESSEAFFNWNFYAAQITGPEERPKTGEAVKNSLYFILPGIMLAIGILLLKRRKESGDKTK